MLKIFNSKKIEEMVIKGCSLAIGVTLTMLPLSGCTDNKNATTSLSASSTASATPTVGNNNSNKDNNYSNNYSNNYYNYYYGNDYNNNYYGDDYNNNYGNNYPVEDNEDIDVETDIIKDDNQKISNEEENNEQELNFRIDDYDINNNRAYFTKDSAKKFQNYISNIMVEYKNSELFNVDAALNEYENMHSLKVTDDIKFISNNKVDEEKLFDNIKENNINFLNTDVTNKYENIKDGQLRNIVSIISSQLESSLKASNKIDISILNNTLKNLKILEYKSFGNAYVDMEKPILGINFSAIESLQKQNPKVNMLERTIKHETNHLIQINYSNGEDFEYNMGMSYSYSNLKVNSLYWQWFVEGSAEKLTLNKISDTPFNYSEQVKGIESLTLANVVNFEDVNFVEKLSLQRDLDSLFSTFNITNNNDKKELINMMFAYDIVFTENDEFINYYKEKIGEFNLIALDNYKKELKPSIASTLTKIFYSNLSEKLVSGESELDDVFLLMRVFETELCRITDYDNPSKVDVNANFTKIYSDIQNTFFEYLELENNISKDEIKQIYCLYSDNYCDDAKYKVEGEYNFNSDIEWLNENQNEFLEHTSKTRLYHINKNINR